MSHTAYFQTLVGKTVTAAEHRPTGVPHTNRETIVLTFEDGTELAVFSYADYTLDAIITLK